MTPAIEVAAISRQAVLAIAEADAIAAYGDLSYLKVEAELKDGQWIVAYRMNRPGRWAGGGPHYVIDATTGEIVSKKYYQ